MSLDYLMAPVLGKFFHVSGLFPTEPKVMPSFPYLAELGTLSYITK